MNTIIKQNIEKEIVNTENPLLNNSFSLIPISSVISSSTNLQSNSDFSNIYIKWDNSQFGNSYVIERAYPEEISLIQGQSSIYNAYTTLAEVTTNFYTDTRTPENVLLSNTPYQYRIKTKRGNLFSTYSPTIIESLQPIENEKSLQTGSLLIPIIYSFPLTSLDWNNPNINFPTIITLTGSNGTINWSANLENDDNNNFKITPTQGTLTSSQTENITLFFHLSNNDLKENVSNSNIRLYINSNANDSSGIIEIPISLTLNPPILPENFVAEKIDNLYAFTLTWEHALGINSNDVFYDLRRRIGDEYLTIGNTNNNVSNTSFTDIITILSSFGNSISIIYEIRTIVKSTGVGMNNPPAIANAILTIT